LKDKFDLKLTWWGYISLLVIYSDQEATIRKIKVLMRKPSIRDQNNDPDLKVLSADSSSCQNKMMNFTIRLARRVKYQKVQYLQKKSLVNQNEPNVPELKRLAMHTFRSIFFKRPFFISRQF
jgi:hypothetical protein